MKFPKIDRYFRRKLNRTAKALFFHDEQAKNDFVGMFGSGKARHEIVPHGIYPESLVPLPEKKLAREYLKIPKTAESVCLFMGRASNQKGYDVVLSHMKFFNKKKIHVIFAGSGFTDEHLKPFANCTVLPYFVPDFELPILFAAADSILLPYSSCTTSGLAVLAIGFGTPLVCSNVPYLKELCDQDLGVVCNHLDPEDFTNKIMASVQLNNKKNYKVSRASFLESNSWDKVAQQTYTQYNSLL